MDDHAGEILASAYPLHCGNTGVGQPTLTTMTSVLHDISVVVPKRIAQVHIAVQEGGRAEAMAFGGTGGKGGKLKGIQNLRAHPQDGPIFQIPGDSNIGGGL